MRVRLLGPVDVVVGGEPRPVRGLRRKAVLAVLALHRGEIVSSDRLAEVVWAGDPPTTSLNTLQRHISYLRDVLESRDAIVPRSPGYLLDPDRVDTDVAVAEGLIRPDAQIAHHDRSRQLRDALALWRGRPLVDVAGLPWLDEQAQGLEQLRLRGTGALVETRLALGEHVQLLPELEALAADHPFDERLHGFVMLALYRCGRQADALAAYRRLRRGLRDELGIDPGQPLRDLEAAILRQDRALELEVTAAPPPALVVTPARPPVAGNGHPLLERESALAQLGEYAAEAQCGEGRLVLVAGEAGVGKSALVERLRQDLPDARWAWGVSDGLFTPRPLGPLFDLAEQLGGRVLELCRAGAGREELFGALLREIGSSGRLDVIVMEDIHWADEATLDLLRFLGRRLREAPVLLVATYRDEGLPAGHPLRVALGDLASQRSTQRIRLAPLSVEAVRLLAGGSGLSPVALHELTGGNPFYLTEVLRAGAVEGEVPASAQDAVLAHAARLGATARGVLDVAALVGTRVEVRLLETVTGYAPSALDELLASGLLVGDGGWLGFRHEIARLAVAQAVPAHRSRPVHHRVLEALRSLGCADESRLAFHADAAGDAAASLQYAPAAARWAARLASHREAAAQFERALRYADGVDPRTLAGLYEGLADAVALLDRWQDAEDAAQRALVLWRQAGDRLREGDTLRRLSRIQWNLCRGGEAVVAAEAAVATLEPLGSTVELAWAYATFANQRMLYAEYDGALDLARRAQLLAARFGATDVLSDALDTQAVCAAVKGQHWTGLMRDALDIALSGGHKDQAARAYTNFCGVHSDRREFAEAQRYLVEGSAYCEEHDITTYATCLRGEQSNLFERTGRWEEASILSAELLADAGPSPANRLCALIRLGALRARRGEPDVWVCLDEAVAIADRAGEPEQQVPARLTRAEAYWLAGRPVEARREAELADDSCANSNPWHRGAVALWLRRTGSARPVRGEVAEPYRLLLAGDPATAAKAWTALGCPYDAAMAMTEDASERSLRQALVILAELGAVPAAGIVRQRLRAFATRSASTRPRKATRTRP